MQFTWSPSCPLHVSLHMCPVGTSKGSGGLPVCSVLCVNPQNSPSFGVLSRLGFLGLRAWGSGSESQTQTTTYDRLLSYGHSPPCDAYMGLECPIFQPCDAASDLAQPELLLTWERLHWGLFSQYCLTSLPFLWVPFLSSSRTRPHGVFLSWSDILHACWFQTPLQVVFANSKEHLL